MVQLAHDYGAGPRSVRDIADKQRLPAKYLEQLLAALKTAGLIRARRGAGGGYQLARAPAEIKLSEVFRVLEGPVGPADCVDDPATCPLERTCPTRHIWVRMHDAALEVLEHTTLQDMLAPVREKPARTGPAPHSNRGPAARRRS